MSAEVEVETVPGLPGEPPAGERVVWQGRPEWRALARNTFKTRWLAAYFAFFAAARFVAVAQAHQGAAGALRALPLIALAAACIGVFYLLAWLHARAAVYTITTRRVVLRIGVALPTTWNLPFKRLAAADLTVRKEGDGDIVLRLTAPNRIGWLLLWPHAQPWHLIKARPTLRAIAEPARVSALLAQAVQAWAAAEAAPVLVADRLPAAPAETSAPAEAGPALAAEASP